MCQKMSDLTIEKLTTIVESSSKGVRNSNVIDKADVVSKVNTRASKTRIAFFFLRIELAFAE